MSPESKPKVIAMIVGAAIVMQQFDATVITTALPQMAISLHTDPVRLSVAVTAYLLSLAVFVPVSGWAADRYGVELDVVRENARRRVVRRRRAAMDRSHVGR